VKNCSSFTYLLCCELVHSKMVSCLWMNMLAWTLKIGFCVKSENLFLLYLLCLLPVLWTGALSGGKLPLNEHACILKIGFCVTSRKLFLLYLLYPLAVLWIGALSEGKLSLNEHVCVLNIGFCVMSKTMFLLYLFAVLWTGSLSDGKLPTCLNIQETFPFLPPLPTCCAVNWCIIRR